MSSIEQLIREYSLTEREAIHFIIAGAFLSGALLLVLILFSSRLIKSRFIKRDAKANRLLTEIVQQLILENDDDSYENLDENQLTLLKDHIKENHHKQVLIDVLMHNQKNFTGVYARRSEAIYAQLNLVKLSLRKVKSYKWHLQIKGLREIASMRYLPAHEQIAQKLYSNNLIVRDECRLALMKLIDYDPLFFLDTMREPLTQWMQIHILDHFDKSPQAPKPDFTRWFKHNEVSIICFAINMSAYFMQQRAKNYFKELLNHHDALVVGETIRAIGLMEAFEFADDVIGLPKHYWNEKIITINALTTIGKVGSSDDHLHFIHSFLSIADHDIQLQAALSLRKFGNQGIQLLEKMIHSDIQKIVLHTAEPLLQK